VGVTNGKDLHALISDAIKDAVNAAAFTVEELAHASLPEARLGREGTTVRKLGETLDGFTDPVEPCQCRGFRELGEIALSALSIQDAIRQSVFSSIPYGLGPQDGLRPAPPEPR
jgi:hypothetical protein